MCCDENNTIMPKVADFLDFKFNDIRELEDRRIKCYIKTI